MILYFADRELNIIGQASTRLPSGLTVTADTKTEDIETGVAIFECKIPFDRDTRSLVESCTEVGNYVLRSYGGENEFYTIIDSELDTYKQTVYIYAEDAGMDLLNEVVGAYEADKAYTIAQYIEMFSGESGFEIGVNEAASLKRKLVWDAESTAAERIASVATQFGGCEVSYSFEIKGLAVTRKYINIYKERGKDLGVQLRLNKEIDSIVTSKSIANLATALQCTGGTPEDENFEDDIEPTPVTLKGYKYDDGDFYVDGTVLKSRKALQNWSRLLWKDGKTQQKGGHITKIYESETLSQSTLCSEAISELKKLREIAVNYEVDITHLPDSVRLGDRVNIIDDAGELYVSARVLQLETSVSEQEHRAILGEYLIKSSGIHKKVADLAAQFAKMSVSAARALAIANTAKANATAAKTQADTAAAEASSVLGKANEALDAATAAQSAAEAAQAAAGSAQAAVGEIEGSIAGMEESVTNAQQAADNAQQAAQTAQSKANDAASSAAQAAADAADAVAAVSVAQSAAELATEKAETAQSTAEAAKADADTAKATAEAAKIDAARARADIDSLGDELDSVSSTMSADYARKTELTEARASLQTQISQNAADISSTAKKLSYIDETANDAKQQLAGARETAEAAQAQADEAAAHAEEAQRAADDAEVASALATIEARSAYSAAQEARHVADTAKADLRAAEADLAAISARADATEAEIAEAQARVSAARAEVDSAKAEADAAAATASASQSAADAAADLAAAARAVASKAADDAIIAQSVANEALGNASKAQTVAAQAKIVAQSAQAAASAAQEDADAAQSTANQATEAARNAQQMSNDAISTLEQAEADLEAARQALEDVESRADATQDEIEAAQAAVDSAQAAADEAASSAESAQAEADTAKAAALAAQEEADAAQAAADAAQAEAAAAQQAYVEAKAAVDGLAVRISAAETNIAQNADEVAITAKKVESVRSELNDAIESQKSEIIATASGITMTALESYVEQSEYEQYKHEAATKLEIEADGIEATFKQETDRLSDIVDPMATEVAALTKNIKINADGITIGDNESGITLVIDNDGIAFNSNKGERLGFWDGENFFSGNIVVEVNERAQFGNFAFLPRSDGSLQFLKVGG